jgi:hypothetical protein
VRHVSDSENFNDIAIETDGPMCDEFANQLTGSGTRDRIETSVEPKRSADSPTKPENDRFVIEICACDSKARDSTNTDENGSACDSKDSDD